MSETRGPALQVALGVAVAVLAFVEIQNAVFTIQSQGRLRDRAVRSIEADLARVRSKLASAFAPGGPAAWRSALDLALASIDGAAEAEVFAQDGRRFAARPAGSQVTHWPSAFQMSALRPGVPVTVGPVAGKGSRFLTYAAFPSGPETLILRLATEAPDLVVDLRERRRILIGHGVALVALVVLAGLALLPRRGASPASGAALEAYTAAMERLRDHGALLAQHHQTELHRMEDQVRDKEAMARAGELTAGMAHEVRNGLGTILGYARLIERGASPEEVEEAARQIREECETLETVVRRFMEFVKRETLILAPFDLARTLSRVVARETRGQGAEVELSAGDMGPVTGDEGLLERAFENLVRNAREAAGPGGRVWVRAERGGGAVAVRVEDDGPGAPVELQDGLRPFFTTKAGGLGLGLPLALKIVRLHGGELELAAREPSGLVVLVRIPETAGSAPSVTEGSVSGGEPAE